MSVSPPVPLSEDCQVLAGTLRGFHMKFSQQAGFQTEVMQYEDPLEMSP